MASSRANELRKSGDIKAALELYQSAWGKAKDKFDGAGMLYCLRKLNQFNTALAKEVYELHSGFDWCRNEYIWMLIQGELQQLPENCSLQEVTATANKILELRPDGIAMRMVVFAVLKKAKEDEDWEVLNEWVSKIDTNDLQEDINEKKDWSFFELWHYYKLSGLVNTDQANAALQFFEEIGGHFPSKKKFFLRLVAKAKLLLQDLEGAAKIYSLLTNNDKVDWWLVHEHGKILMDLNKNDEALQSLYKAASLPPNKYELKVSLFNDIGITSIKLSNKKAALIHFVLEKMIREKKEWNITSSLTNNIDTLKNDLPDFVIPKSIAEAIRECKKLWTPNWSNSQSSTIKTKNLQGKVRLGEESKPYCFIHTSKSESFFCSKSELPKEIKDNQLVRFDLKNSFDKKKKENSWKAVNISII